MLRELKKSVDKQGDGSLLLVLVEMDWSGGTCDLLSKYLLVSEVFSMVSLTLRAGREMQESID